MSEAAVETANDAIRQKIESQLLLQDRHWLAEQLGTKSVDEIARDLKVDAHLVAERQYHLATTVEGFPKPDFMIEEKLRELAAEHSDIDLSVMYFTQRPRICYWRNKFGIAPFRGRSSAFRSPHLYTPAPTLEEKRIWGSCRRCYWTAEIVLVLIGRKHWQLEPNQKLQPEEDGSITHVGCGGKMRLSR